MPYSIAVLGPDWQCTLRTNSIKALLCISQSNNTPRSALRQNEAIYIRSFSEMPIRNESDSNRTLKRISL